MRRQKSWLYLGGIGISLFLISISMPYRVAATKIICPDNVSIEVVLPVTDDPSTIPPLHPNVPIRFTQSLSTVWLLDDKPIPFDDTGQWCTQFSIAGTHIVVPQDNPSTRFELKVESYTNITVSSLLPNPIGKDTQAEKITLANGNDHTVTINQWRLKSRASSTAATIGVTIPARGEAVVTVSNKLVNTGGTYDLFNESGLLVDSIAYGQASEGHIFARAELLGLSAPTSAKASHSPTAMSERVTITGTIEEPQGSRFFIKPTDGVRVRVVIHPDFDSDKPRFHTGDTVRLSGIWKESTDGKYLSIQAGDEITLISTKPAQAKSSQQAQSKPSFLNQKSVSPVTASISSEPVSPSPAIASWPLTERHQASLFVIDHRLKWLFTLMISLGAYLIFPGLAQSQYNKSDPA